MEKLIWWQSGDSHWRSLNHQFTIELSFDRYKVYYRGTFRIGLNSIEAAKDLCQLLANDEKLAA